MKKKAIIVDIDGTISENVTGRPWYGDAKGMLQDKPIESIMGMIRSFVDDYELDVLILTGRHEGKEREATLKWLEKNWFIPDKLYTRDLKDFSKSAEYKRKVYEEQIEPFYDVIMVFEDSNSCVKMFRDKGLLVLQPQNSDY